MSENTNKIFNNIVKNDNNAATIAFGTAIREKLDDALEVRKVGLTSQIFNTEKEESK
jgi:hypothetical protein